MSVSLFYSREMCSVISENLMFICVSAFAFEVSVWEEVCFTVSSGVSPLILHTQAKSVLTHGNPYALRKSVPLFIYTANCHRVSPEFYQVAHLRTDSVHYRDPAGTGPVVLKVVPVSDSGAAFSGIIHGPTIVRLSFPTPKIYSVV